MLFVADLDSREIFSYNLTVAGDTLEVVGPGDDVIVKGEVCGGSMFSNLLMSVIPLCVVRSVVIPFFRTR